LARRRGRLRQMSKQATENDDQRITSLTGRRWRQEDAESVLAAWEESGLSLSGFAAKQGVNVQRLSWWRKQLEERDRGGARGRKKRPAVLSFIPAVMSASTVRVVLRLPRGVEVEVADTGAVPAAWLAEAVKALEGLS
jgi:transposase-like protein